MHHNLLVIGEIIPLLWWPNHGFMTPFWHACCLTCLLLTGSHPHTSPKARVAPAGAVVQWDALLVLTCLHSNTPRARIMRGSRCKSASYAAFQPAACDMLCVQSASRAALQVASKWAVMRSALLWSRCWQHHSIDAPMALSRNTEHCCLCRVVTVHPCRAAPCQSNSPTS